MILDLYGCPREILDDYDYLQEVMETAISMSGATLLRIFGEKFSPQGVTLLALLAESHASIHTWPEQGYAAVDLYTCNSEGVTPHEAAEYIKEKLGATDVKEQEVERQTTL
ncbi:MAG: adenosylmethionine decarboxylase [Actinobacteria bacterium]|nr:adenosylmethionine decarboxylase [Actinomycetota bacterium]